MFDNLADYLPSIFATKDSNLSKLLSIFSDEMNEINQNIEKIKLWRDIGHAEGAVLDRIGNNVGEKRNGLGDELYRVMIKTRIASNLSGGEIPKINEVMQVILGGYYQGIIETHASSEYDNEPAAIIIQSSNTPSFVAEDGSEIIRDDILEVAKRIVTAGVRVDWIIPKYIISPIIQAENDVIYQVHTKAITEVQAVNDVSYNLAMNFQQGHTDLLNGYHVLNGETLLDGRREFCVNKVNVQEVV